MTCRPFATDMPFRIAVFIAVLLLPSVRGSADEQPLRFVHILQQNGYGDVAVDYLEVMNRRADLPSEVRDVLDLEMAKSLMAAADDAFDAREREQLIQNARAHLAKFLRDKPDHPAAGDAAACWGGFLLRQAIASIEAAKPLAGKDKEQQEKYLAAARNELVEARDRFEQARRIFDLRLAAIPHPAEQPTKRSERDEAQDARAAAEENLHESQFQVALTDYYLAQTYADAKDERRTKSLKKAAEEFDDVFQRNRGRPGGLTLAGLKAHAWHGKTVEELGDFTLALDIYDEVLANQPEPGSKAPATGLEPLFTQVELFRLQILAKQDPQQFLSEATSWLQHYRRLKQTDGYQGVALEVAKSLFAASDSASGPEKAKNIAETLRILAEMSKIRGRHQHEAVLMRRDVLKAAGKSDLGGDTFDTAVALGDAAAADSRWQEAQASYEKALAIAEKTNLNDEEAIAAVRAAASGARLMIANNLFRQGKYAECIEAAGKIVHDNLGENVARGQNAIAAQASAIAVEAALLLYAEAPADQQSAALDKLNRLAEFTERHWPDRPEADDARMARAKAKLVVEKIRDAIDVFERVNPKSARYPVALGLAGQCYWRLYVTERVKPEDKRNADQMDADRAKAVERLTAGIALLKDQAKSSQAVVRTLADMQLLLAEIRMEGGDAEGAAALYQPLVDAVRAERPKTLDDATLRVFLGAVRAYCAAGHVDKVGEVGALLVDLGPDTPQVNAALVNFARLLDAERKKAEAQATELESTMNDAAWKKAKQRVASLQKLLGKTLVKLAGRKEVSLAGMVFVGDALAALDMTTEAGSQYQKILHRAETDADFAKTAEKAMPRVRAHLAGLLRAQGKYEDALKQVNLLLKDYPNQLELLMEKGLILQEWSERDPSHFPEAVAHWVTLRGRLQATPGKKPPEYYDVMYNVAACLMREAETSKDKAMKTDRAKQAEQVLKSALILSPKLNGPDTVARYKALLAKAVALQGRTK